MTITEFANSRGEQPQTIFKYVKAHEDEFEGLIIKKGKTRELTDKAIEILDVKYPLPKPVTIINGIPEEEHYKALEERDEQIKKLQSVIIELQAQQSANMLELGDLRARTALLEGSEQELEVCKAEIERMRNRGFWARLRNK